MTRGKINMKLTLFLSAFLMMPTTAAFGQEAISPSKSKIRIDQLLRKAVKHDKYAILELGNSGDVSAIPHLQKLLERRSKFFSSAAGAAHAALAKLGQKQQFDEILKQVDSDEPAIQQDAINKLTYIANNEAIRALFKIISTSQHRKPRVFGNKPGPHGEMPDDIFIADPLAIWAMDALSKIVPDTPPVPKRKYSDDDFKRWQAWWEQNKDKYQ
jgi:hypothetical protein